MNVYVRYQNSLGRAFPDELRPVDRALSIVSELTERVTFRAVVLDILRLLKGGKSLADSIATYPAYFSDLYLNMERAGEAYKLLHDGKIQGRAVITPND